MTFLCFCIIPPHLRRAWEVCVIKISLSYVNKRRTINRTLSKMTSRFLVSQLWLHIKFHFPLPFPLLLVFFVLSTKGEKWEPEWKIIAYLWRRSITPNTVCVVWQTFNFFSFDCLLEKRWLVRFSLISSHCFSPTLQSLQSFFRAADNSGNLSETMKEWASYDNEKININLRLFRLYIFHNHILYNVNVH